MGKGNWFSSVKKALSPDSKEKKDPKPSKSKKKWFGKEKQLDLNLNSNSTAVGTETHPSLPPVLPPPPQIEPEDVKFTDGQREEITDPYPVTITSDAGVNAAPQIPVEDVQVRTIGQYSGKSKEEVAAIKIQTAFRGYQARRALRALRGLVRLRSLIEGPTVKRQVSSTLRCMQTLARVQSQIHSRRIRMSEENQALQKQLLQKRAKELENLRIGEEWDDSLQSKEQIESNLLKKFEAAMRRERALAYAFTHQQTWKNSSKVTGPMFMDPNNPAWGWSWLERWMATRPWEGRNTSEKESNNDLSSVKSLSIGGGEISRSYARYQLNADKNSPTASQKSSQINGEHFASTPRPVSTLSRKMKSASPKVSVHGADDDSKSMVSMQSENRRHSIGASVRDDESLASSQSIPSYMIATESARAKSRLQVALEKNGTPDKAPPATVKKRLSFPPSPARPRRQSAPPKVNNPNSSVISESSVTNGGES